jgi:hypothetical protein
MTPLTKGIPIEEGVRMANDLSKESTIVRMALEKFESNALNFRSIWKLTYDFAHELFFSMSRQFLWRSSI